MTPREKAFELIDKYSRILPMNQTTLLDHKNCAATAVDEILSENQKRIVDRYLELGFINYWEEVKQEIEKI